MHSTQMRLSAKNVSNVSAMASVTFGARDAERETSESGGLVRTRARVYSARVAHLHNL